MVVSPRSELNSWTTLPELLSETLKVQLEKTIFCVSWSPREKLEDCVNKVYVEGSVDWLVLLVFSSNIPNVFIEMER